MGILKGFQKRNESLKEYTDHRLEAEIEETENWLSMARHRANMITEIEKKMRLIRKALLDEKTVRVREAKK